MLSWSSPVLCRYPRPQMYLAAGIAAKRRKGGTEASRQKAVPVKGRCRRWGEGEWQRTGCQRNCTAVGKKNYMFKLDALFGLKVQYQYYRKLKGMTQEAFADKVGISWSYLAKIESPTRAFGVSMEKLFTIADALEVPVAKLFED